MADKKVKKIATDNKKSRDFMSGLRGLSIDELQKKLQLARADLLEAQKSLKASELANPHAITKMKKEIAKILTVMGETNNSNSEALSDDKTSDTVKKEAK